MSTMGKKYLVTSLHNKFYALDLSQTAEVVDPPKLWPIPNASAHFCGAMNFHNRIVAVMNLATALGLPPVADHDKLIVLDPALASLAFMVERVVRILHYDEILSSTASESPFIEGIFTIPEGTVSLLRCDKLIRFAADTI